MKIALVDIETGGLDPSYHDIIEIAAIVFDSETLEELDSFEMKVLPYAEVTPEARKINGYNPAEWKDAFSLRQAMSSFAHVTRDCVLMAQNVAFDWSFIEKALDKNIKHSLHYHKLDLASMAWEHFPEIRSGKESMSLRNLAKLTGVEPEPEIHRAMNGAHCAFEIYKKLRSMK